MNTNKIFLAFVLILGALFNAQAQRHSLGPTIGVNFTDLGNVDYNTSFQPGLNVGLIYNYSKHEHFGFGTGIRYSQEGAKLDGIDGYTKLNYLRIPLKFQYFFGEMDDRFRPKVYVGPSVGFLLGGKQKVQIGELVVEDNIDRNDFNTVDLGLMVQLRIERKRMAQPGCCLHTWSD